jgi:hypothetical protein
MDTLQIHRRKANGNVQRILGIPFSGRKLWQSTYGISNRPPTRLRPRLPLWHVDLAEPRREKDQAPARLRNPVVFATHYLPVRPVATGPQGAQKASEDVIAPASEFGDVLHRDEFREDATHEPTEIIKKVPGSCVSAPFVSLENGWHGAHPASKRIARGRNSFAMLW